MFFFKKKETVLRLAQSAPCRESANCKPQCGAQKTGGISEAGDSSKRDKSSKSSSKSKDDAMGYARIGPWRDDVCGSMRQESCSATTPATSLANRPHSVA